MAPPLLSPPPGADCWSSWLAAGRDGGEDAQRARVAAQVDAYAARLLELVPTPPATMLDIGSGEGLMAWAALRRWPGLAVTLTDISAPLLARAAAEAQARGLTARCRFLHCPAETLAGAADETQALVSSRAALAYVPDKPAALRAALRVLRPGGVLALCEPLFREDALATIALRATLATARSPLAGLLHKWKAAQFPDTEAAMEASPVTAYTERDILGFARAAGFRDLHLELHIDERPAPARDWAGFCATAPHPLAPSLADILARHFSAAERVALEAALRPLVEAGGFTTTSHILYLRGTKPG